MIARSAILPALALAASALTAGIALAQEAAPAAPAAPATTQAPAAAPVQDNGAAYESARNQLGVLTYCQQKGFIDGKAVETQTKLLAMIPAGDTAKGDAAEAKGKEGTVSAMGVERSLADAATEQKTTEEALCKQMDTLLQQLAAQVPS
ncbi:pore-forming ESAT-6 family protein [Paracoccus sp. CPCC 101403]|uniref:Pore-forming ESAT-6 family protein n=2 Tax=Paracoccus broussonetiae TaxID=3075834 RepID=A0ABU3EAJ7_9RHOB|nr:pore-forming ESAT-6 family protein [Paracoccus sp. CPCC 101403]MDT1061242.1 pore-forming ESAT-6 family protein [Paracoccus sp. CPCC 101403]